MATAQKQQKAALGKGIRALLSNIDEDLRSSNTVISDVPVATTPPPPNPAGVMARIPVADIVANPEQPRKDFDEQALRELSESIAQHDMIQPITVVKLASGGYQLISGERRLRASRMAGLQDVPAYVRPLGTSQEMLELALLENLQREDLNAIEVALSYRRLMDECDLTQEAVAGRMNKERSTVTNYLRLLKLPPDIQRAVRDGSLSMGHARAITSLDAVDKQLYAWREVREKQLSVRQTEALVKALQQDEEKKAPPAKENKLPPAYRRIEDQMASHFSTKVHLDRNRSGKGSVTIEFYSDEDLERIMDAMKL